MSHLGDIYQQNCTKGEHETVATGELDVQVLEVGEIEHMICDYKHHELVVHLHFILVPVLNWLSSKEEDGITVIHEE